MYIVRTKEIEPTAENGQQEFFDNILHPENIDNELGNRFPFECPEKSKIEVYQIGSYEECNDFLTNKIPSEIQDYFTIEEYIEC